MTLLPSLLWHIYVFFVTVNYSLSGLCIKTRDGTNINSYDYSITYQAFFDGMKRKDNMLKKHKNTLRF
jgi:hypothetical protein